ncbi:hypothetical protein BH23VER1_BH23VER1_07120 [soil metagenome]
MSDLPQARRDRTRPLLTGVRAFGTLLGVFLPAVAMAQASPLISEFLAVNETTLADEDGDFSDWIELFNPGIAQVSLGGYFLTDAAQNPTKWRIPDGTTLPPGGALVIFASDKARADPAGTLHTNFKLTSAGEYLALVSPGGTVIHAFSPAFPPQSADVSYGLAGSDAVGEEGYFDPPTPGQPNPSTFSGTSSTVAFSVGSQLFVGSLEVGLEGAAAGETIRFTLDRSVPTATSPAYLEPLILTATTQVRARIFTAGGVPGPVSSHTFVAVSAGPDTSFLGSRTADFGSHLPVVVLTNFGQGKPDASKDMHWFLFEPGGDPATATVLASPDLSTRGRMKVRGSSTAGFPKYSMNLEAWDEEDADKDVSVLGMPSESDWVLSGRYQFDRALIRNPFMYALSNQIGSYAVRTRFVEVFLDTNGGMLENADYAGVFTLMEKIKRDGNRVDVVPLSPGDTAEPDVTGGYIFKQDRIDAGETGIVIPGFERPLVYVDPEEPELVPQQRTYLEGFLNDLASAVAAPDGMSPNSQPFDEMLDLPSWIDHHWLNVLAMNVDAFRLSAYYSKDRLGPVVAGPIWDFDRSMESTDGRDDNPEAWDGTGDSSKAFTDTRYPWWTDLLARPDVRQQHTDRWFALRRGAFSTDSLHGLVDAMAAEIGVAQERNFARWAERPPRQSYQWEIDNMKDWLARRVAWIDDQYPDVPSVQLDPGGAVVAGDVLLGARDGTIYFTLDGTDPRSPGGSVAQGADARVAGSIPETVVSEDAACRYLVPTDDSVDAVWRGIDFDDAAWKPGLNGLGWDTTPDAGLSSQIVTDIRADIEGVNTTAYVRFPFEFSGDPAAVVGAVLGARYDDGFIAYLNGAKIAEANAPTSGTPGWNSGARAANQDASAIVSEPFAVGAAALQSANLRQGTNVLAIHMLNTTAGGDILFRGSLELHTAVEVAPLELAEPALLTARTLVGDTWGAPATVYVPVGQTFPLSENLVVSEVMYHPADPTAQEIAAGHAEQSDFEFIELLNIGAVPVSLFGVALTDGVEFGFGGTPAPALAPGERAVLVSDAAAFAFRYGGAVPIAGEFVSGNLNNAGERVELAAAQNPLHAFEYGDAAPWPAAADQGGISLVLRNPYAAPDHALAANWTAGQASGGTPGAPEHSYEAWKVVNGVLSDTGDDDLDGAPNLVEYLLGTGPSDPSSGFFGASAPAFEWSESGAGLAVTLTLDGPALESGARMVAQWSSALTGWSNAGIRVAAPSAVGDGQVKMSYLLPVHPGPASFVRFRAEAPSP